MKILHVWNTAGVGSIIAKYMDRIFGIQSLVVTRQRFDKFGLTTYGKRWECGAKAFKVRVLWESWRYDLIHIHAFDEIFPLLKTLYPKKLLWKKFMDFTHLRKIIFGKQRVTRSSQNVVKGGMDHRQSPPQNFYTNNLIGGNITPERTKKTKILFVHLSLPSFVRKDLEILERNFNVKKMRVRTFLVPRRGRDPLVFLRLLKGILWADIVYSWFANLNALFIVLFCMFLRKKCMIVAGGYDVVKVPEIGYGMLLNPMGARMMKFVLERATRILSFSDYAREKILDITKSSNIDVIHVSYDSRRFKPSEGRKENIVLTVCNVTKGNITRKGLKTFIKSARYLPRAKFVLIGSHKDNAINYLKEISSPNVEFTGYVSEEELVKWYQRAKVYCQLSYEEGAGVALREAIACECIPVVSLKARALRETVGEYGFYVPYGDVKATVKAINKALSAPRDIGARARERVKNLFSIEKREKELLRSINDIRYTHK